ncbi:MAG: hypothetical protein ACRECV_13955 [Xanthobacteraceae bacterium]
MRENPADAARDERERLNELTDGKGPEKCIDATGLESHVALRANNPKSGNVASALLMILGIGVIDFVAAQYSASRHRRDRGSQRLHSDRSGFPHGIQAARGAAKEAAKDFHKPNGYGAGAANRTAQQSAARH